MFLTIIVFLLMLISPVVSMMAMLLKRAERNQSANWPQVIGQVTAVQLRESKKQYQPELDVAYTIDGQDFTSRQYPISQTGKAAGSKTWAREFSLQFKPETAVTLFYDPKRPKRSTLNPQTLKVNSPRWQILSGITILLAMGLHMIAARALLTTYLNLSGSSLVVVIFFSTLVSLLLGAALGLLLGEERRQTA